MSNVLFDDENTVSDLILCATAHGNESGNDHEIGDLQGLLEKAWSLMSPEMRRDMISSLEVSEIVELGTGHVLLTSVDGIEQGEWESACEAYGLDTSFQYSDVQMLDAINHARLANACESQEAVSSAVLAEATTPPPAPDLAKPRRMRP
ncbi:hypothetical protein [Hydrogenophaga sp. 2FB]|uniref:hypothetical protein n=1 Tax=Hydrogenophaga sp. 2FB TaxID=2502187 RepID=UPI0010FA3CBC|nr:hypothetical protein [Hydrogenophaga sp. 2FB]